MANKHFFQPLLPGFHSHLTIPVAFFLKNIQGRYDEQKTTELRSDASKKIWEVKIDGRRLTDGWKEFALSHNLQMGDIVVFRQESDMSFHVTPLGSSCCEIQYGSCSDKESNSESEEVKKVKKNPKREEESSSLDPSCLVANVSPASLHYDLLYLPKRFVRVNGIDIGSTEIVLMNEKGRRSWTLSLREKQSCGTTYIRGGWRSFCGANGLEAGDIVTFRLSQRGGTLVLRSLSSKEPEEEANEVVSLSTESECDGENIGKIQMKENPRREIESSSLDTSCFVANVSPGTLRYDRLNLPKSFVRENGLDTRCGEIVLMNEKGRSWTLELKGKDSDQVTYIRGGWRSFCGDNGLKAGGIVTFKLIQRGGTLALRFLSSKEPEEEEANEVVSLSTEPESEEEINIGKIQRKKNPRRETESSLLDTSCFVANVVASTLRYDTLYLPTKFVRASGVDTRCGEIVLMNEKGRSWTLKMKQKPSCGTTYIRRGWRSFCRGNGLKAGSFFTCKLIRKGRTQVLCLSRNEPEEECSESNEVESLSTEPESDGESSQEERKISQECSISKGKKGRLIWKPSFSSSQDRFVTLTLRAYNINCSALRLPVPFTRKNGINEETKMTMLDKHGVKWPVNLRSENDKRIRLRGSWKDFLKANCVKTNESIRLELIWEKDSSCVLKFCSKVKR